MPSIRPAETHQHPRSCFSKAFYIRELNYCVPGWEAARILSQSLWVWGQIWTRPVWLFGRISSELISSNNDRYIWIKSMFRFKRNTVEMLLYFLSTNCLQIIKYYWCFGQSWLDFVIFKKAIPLNLLKYLVSDVCSKQNIDIDCYSFMFCLLMFHSLETLVTSV